MAQALDFNALHAKATNGWEHDFLTSVEDQLGRGRAISAKQQAIIERIANNTPPAFEDVQALSVLEELAKNNFAGVNGFAQNILNDMWLRELTRFSDKQRALIMRYARQPDSSERSVELKPGVYELPTGEIYVVKFNRKGDRLYAKRLVEAPSERLTEQGARVDFDFKYEAGAVYTIRPEYQMELEKAKALMIRYGRCIVCGRRLKVAESVERGIGPVCITYFRGTLRSERAHRQG